MPGMAEYNGQTISCKDPEKLILVVLWLSSPDDWLDQDSLADAALKIKY